MTPIRIIALTLCPAALLACGGSDAPPGAAADAPAADRSAAAPAAAAPAAETAPPPPRSGYEVLGVGLREAPAGVQVTGRVVDGFRWRDQTGENLLLLTETGEIPSRPSEDCSQGCRDAELYAYQLVRRGDAWEPVWRVTDFVRGCDLDMTVEFVAGSLGVTDLDGDGTAESIFQYTLGCRGGVDPAARKLIMHEGATKYAIRGTTDISRIIGKEYGGGERNVDPSFQRAPAELREHALAEWDRLVTHDMGQP